MDDIERQREHAERAQELEGCGARLEQLETEARERRADAALAEIESLRTVRERLLEELDAMRAADQLSFEEGCASMREDIAELYDRIEGAAERMQGDIGMGTDERLEIMFGQLGSAVELMLQRMEEESSRDEAVGEDAREQLRREWHEAAERRYALRGSDETEREGLRDRLEVALVRVQERVERVMARLRSLREQHADQPHG